MRPIPTGLPATRSKPSISPDLPAVSIRNYRAGNSSGFSLRAHSARSGNRSSTASPPSCSWTNRVSSLDIRHQLTIMRLARNFCQRGGGVIAIMHDLNLTAMFADQMVMMKAGCVKAAGHPREVMTDEVMEAVFGCAMRGQCNTGRQHPLRPAAYGGLTRDGITYPPLSGEADPQTPPWRRTGR